MKFFEQFFGPPTMDKFARQVMRSLKAAGDTRKANYDAAEARILFTEEGRDAGVMNLRNLFGEYCSLPKGERQAWMRRTMLGLLNHMEIPEEFEDVKPDLYPSVRTKSMPELMRLDAKLQGKDSLGLSLVWTPLSDCLATCLVYDLPQSMCFVTQDHLDKWGISLYEALEAARQNLEEKPCTIAALDERVYVFATNDAYDATRMLLTDRIRKLKIQGSPLVVPLSRDTLFLTGSEDEEGQKILLDLVEEQKDNPRPVLPIPHVLGCDDWQVWTPPPGNPHADRFRRLEVEYFHGEYAEQKSLLDQLHEQDGMDLFVASYTAIEKDDKLLSYCVWAETVTTLLPKTQYVAFIAQDQNALGLVPWERVLQVMGDEMQVQESYPPRWLIDSFPDENQIARLQPADLPD